MIRNVFFFDNGMLAVFDERGMQIPELQGKADESWPKVLERLKEESEVNGQFELIVHDPSRESL